MTNSVDCLGRIEITGDFGTVFLTGIYDKEAIMSASYRYIDRYAVLVDLINDKYQIQFTHKGPANKESMHSDLLAFQNDVLDEQLRNVLGQKTGSIRELIVRHAFSPIDLKKELSR